MFGISICTRLQNGLASCLTDISDHFSAGQLEAELWARSSYHPFAFLKKVDNFTSRPVVLFSCFVSELCSESLALFPAMANSCACGCFE